MPKKKITVDFLWQQWQQNKITLDEYFAFVNDGIIPAIFATPDTAHVMTDEMIAKMEKKIRREYEQAAKDMGRKYREYMKAFREEDAMLKEQVKAGLMSKADYKAWRVRHLAQGEQFTQMRDLLAFDMEHAHENCMGIINGQMPDVFALNANWAQYQIANQYRIDADFTLYSRDTARYLLAEQRQLMPGPSDALQKKIAADKAMKWNQKKIQSAVLQGVLQGEGSEEIAERLRSVAQMGYNAAVRYARTMTTSAQNAGRYEGYHRAKELGIDLTIEWQAILDAHTRHTHRMMHGQRRDVDEPFEVDGIKILYPAQSSGPGASTIPQSMIWNCRCTLLAWVKGYEGDTVKSSPGMGEMSFDEWQHALEPKKMPAPALEDRFSPERKAAALKFDSRYDADKYYRPKLDDNWQNMDDWEKYGTWEYTHNSNPINKSLSGYHDSWDRSSYIGPANTDWGHEDRWRYFEHSKFRNQFGKDDHVDFHHAITSLTTGIEKNVLQDDVWLRRGGGFSGLASLAEGGGLDFEDTVRILQQGTEAEKDALKQMLLGRPCQEHSFLPTGIASDAGFNRQVSYDIYAPKGTKAIYAEPQSYYGSTIGHNEKIYELGHSWSGNVGSEAEVIIQRGSFYRITDIEYEPYGGGVHVTMEVIDQPDYFKFGDEDTFNGGATRHLR